MLPWHSCCNGHSTNRHHQTNLKPPHLARGKARSRSWHRSEIRKLTLVSQLAFSSSGFSIADRRQFCLQCTPRQSPCDQPSRQVDAWAICFASPSGQCDRCLPVQPQMAAAWVFQWWWCRVTLLNTGNCLADTFVNRTLFMCLSKQRGRLAHQFEVCCAINRIVLQIAVCPKLTVVRPVSLNRADAMKFQ